MGEHNNEGDLADTEGKKEIDSERGEDKAILDDEVEGSRIASLGSRANRSN